MLSFGITKSTVTAVSKGFLKIFGGLLANPGNPEGGCKMSVWLLATAFGALIRSMKS